MHPDPFAGRPGRYRYRSPSGVPAVSFDAVRLVTARIDDAGADLSASARWVLTVLAIYENSDTHQCHPSVASIARRTGYATSTVNDALRRLVATGDLTIEPVSGRPNRYRINAAHPPDHRRPSDYRRPTAGDRSRATLQNPSDRRSQISNEQGTNQQQPLGFGRERLCMDCSHTLTDDRRLKTRCLDCQTTIDTRTTP